MGCGGLALIAVVAAVVAAAAAFLPSKVSRLKAAAARCTDAVAAAEDLGRAAAARARDARNESLALREFMTKVPGHINTRELLLLLGGGLLDRIGWPPWWRRRA